MEYKGKLYGKVGNMYIPLTETSEYVDRLKELVSNIGFEPTMNGSVFKPRCGYKKFHELLNELNEEQNKTRR